MLGDDHPCITRSAADPQCIVGTIRSLSVMATVPSSWPPEILVTTLDGSENRRKIKQLTRAGCSRSLAEASSCIAATGSSYGEVANNSAYLKVVRMLS